MTRSKKHTNLLKYNPPLFFWAEKGLLQDHARRQMSQAKEKPRAPRRILAKDFLSFLLFFNFTILYWLCHISTWIHHRYTRVPHPEPSALPVPSLWVIQCTSPKQPVSCIEPGLETRFIYDVIHVSMPFSQIIPPSHSPTESKRLFYTSVSLLLSHIQGYCNHLSKFHIYALVYCIGVFLSGLLHSV